MLKKIMLLSVSAVLLTACNNEPKEKNKPVNSVGSSETSKEDSSESGRSKSEKEVSKPLEITEDVFKDIINNPAQYYGEASKEFKYVIKKTDTSYLLLSAKSKDAGLYTTKIFVYDKNKKAVVKIEDTLTEGVAGAGGFRGSLIQYKDNPNKLMYFTFSSGSGRYVVQDINFNNNDIDKVEIKTGRIPVEESLTEKAEEIRWVSIGGASSKPSPDTTTTQETSTSKTTVEETSTSKVTETLKSNLDFDELLKKNFSSASGQYTSEDFIYNISEGGINVKAPHLDHEVDFKIKSTKKENNYVLVTVSLPAEYTNGQELDAIFVFVPAGTDTPPTVANLGDKTKDRVLIYNPDRRTNLLNKK